MTASDTLQFFRAFLRNPATVGAITPSSPALARVMLDGIDFETVGSVLEFGPGTGAFTAALAEHMTRPEHYLGIEQDERLAQLLGRRFPKFRFALGSAENAVAHHADAALPETGAIISGLPFTTLPSGVQDRVIDALETLLPPGGIFRTFQYVHAYGMPGARRFRARMIERLGAMERSAPVLRNPPPAFVLTWRRPQN